MNLQFECLENDWLYCFWRSSWANNWTTSPFTYNGVEYRCAEQALMHGKAIMFNDIASAEKIMKTPNPKVQKALGRQVKGFDQLAWDRRCEELMYEILLAKFTAPKNAHLLLFLLSTGNKYIAESSPVDLRFSVGMCPEDAVKLPSLEVALSTWKGTNFLGKALMKVREQIRNNRQEK